MESETEAKPAGARDGAFRITEQVALVIASICLGAGLVEAAMWSLYDRPWYDKLTGEQADTSPRDYTKNEFGLRDAPYPLPPPAGQRRILVLGDSFTFGLGVRDDRAIFPHLLEVQLNERLDLPGVESVHVMNGGIPGSLTNRWLALWKRIGNDYRPDLVLIVFFLRDGTKTHSIPDFFGVIQEEITQRNRKSLLYQSSFTWRRIRDNLDRQEVGARYTRRFRESYFGDESQTGEWRAAQSNLLEIRDRVRKSGAQVAMAIFPVLVELTDRYPFTPICDLLEKFARENDMPVLNLLPAFMGRQSDDLWVSTFDQHPNAEGHRIAAQALTPFVSELIAGVASPSSAEPAAAQVP